MTVPSPAQPNMLWWAPDDGTLDGTLRCDCGFTSRECSLDLNKGPLRCPRCKTVTQDWKHVGTDGTCAPTKEERDADYVDQP